MRKFMTKEVKVTVIKSGRIKLNENNLPELEVIPTEEIIGEVTTAKAFKHLTKKFGHGLSIYSLETESRLYKMEVTKFMELAELVTDGEEGETEEEETEEEETEETEEEEQPQQPEPPTDPEQKRKGGIKIIPKEEQQSLEV